MRKSNPLILLAVITAAILQAACDSGGAADDAGTDSDTDADSDADSDADTDTDSDTDSDTDGDTEPNITADGFTRHTVDADCAGAAFVSVADVTGDGLPDLVVSSFGALSDIQMRGSLTIYAYDGDLDTWEEIPVVTQSTTLKFPNQNRVADVDGDLDNDIIVPAGFLACTMGGLAGGCGSLSWFENNGDGTSWERREIVPFGSDLFYHGVQLADLDDDGIDDLVTVGEEMGSTIPASPDQAVAGWFKGTDTAARFELTPRVMGQGLGSLPDVMDIDGDGDLDFASAEYFVENGSFAWMEQTAAPSVSVPAGTWARHVIDNTVGPSIKLAFIEDLYGDSVTRAVGSNHTNVANGDPESAVYVYDIPDDDTTAPWDREKISEGIVSVPGTAMAPMAAPGIFGWGDIDGDGDIDIALSGDGDKRFFILEQLGPGQFATVVIEDPLGQAGGMKVVDIDGDGNAEIVVTGYEANAVYVYKWNG